MPVHLREWLWELVMMPLTETVNIFISAAPMPLTAPGMWRVSNLMMDGQTNKWPVERASSATVPLNEFAQPSHHLKLLVSTSLWKVFAQGLCMCWGCRLVCSSTSSLPSLFILVIWISAPMYFPHRDLPQYCLLSPVLSITLFYYLKNSQHSKWSY